MGSRTFIPLIILTAVFTSCQIAFMALVSNTVSVAISNNTNTDKKIKVIYPANFKYPVDDFYIRDSLTTYNLSTGDNYRHPIIIPITSLDTIARTYSFTLKPNHKAIVENRPGLDGFPTYGQIFIIDNTDTVELKKHEKIFIKNPKVHLGGTWTYTIIDKK